MVGRPFQDVQKWSVSHPGCLGVVRRPSRMSWSGREDIPDILVALPNVRE